MLRTLNDEERNTLTKTGLCMGCPREMTEEVIWAKVNTDSLLGAEAPFENMNKLLRRFASTVK